MKLTVAQFEYVKSFVWERLDRTCISLFEWTSEDGSNDEYAEEVLSEACRDMSATDFSYGCTKSCIYFNELEDFVIKIPFRGTRWDVYEDDDYAEEYPETQYDEFTGSRSTCCWDYCEAEADIYQKAVDRGVEDLLCGTWYLGMYHGHPIYVSERADREFSWAEERNYPYITRGKSQALARCLRKNRMNYFEEEILSMMIDVAGIVIVNRLMHFIEDNNISDFHSGNFMCMKDGSVRLIDYSSYHG